MAASAIFRGNAAARIGQRPPGRVHVIAWAIAATAILAAGASALFGAGSGAIALVATAPAEPLGAHPLPGDVPPAEALIDPRAFRKTPPPAGGRPVIAVVLSGLGVSVGLTDAAVAKLPPEISLSFSPYGRSLQKQADGARAAGHEVFVDVPMEPQGFPGNDAGPQAILSSLSEAENLERLHWILGRFTGFAGTVLAGGSPALNSPETIAPLLSGASMKGLVWAHAKARGFDGIAAETAEIALAIDATAEPDAIDAVLEQLEARARRDGSVLAIAGPYPVTVQRLAAWAADLESRGLVLVPASALARAPPAEQTAEASPHDAPETATIAHEAPASEAHAPPVSEVHGTHH